VLEDQEHQVYLLGEAENTAAARRRGAWGLGRPGGIRTPIKVTREQDKLVRRMKADGEKVASIARATGLSRVTIYRILGRPAVAAK
jgi:DNA invertase Pin-like site-specific DNA recombinase